MPLIITSITTLVSLLLVIGLMVRHNQDKKELRDLQEQVCYAQRELKLMDQNYINEQQKTARLLNRITKMSNELHHNREEIDTLKGDINILLLKNKLHSCEPLPPYEEESDLAAVTHTPPTIFQED